jgi:hypothetical protein
MRSGRRNVVLLELLSEADQGAFGVCRGIFEWRADEDHDTLAEVLVLPMLKCKLRDGNRRGDGSGAPQVRGRIMHGREDVADLLSVRDEHLGTV